MKISGATGTGGNLQAQRAGRNGGEDAFSKNIQQQLANLNQQLQQLSSNKNMTPEEKMKKRQEIQQEIVNLNQQLRQHQMEIKREQQAAQTEALSAGSREEERIRAQDRKGGMSLAGMAAMIGADSSIKQAKAQGGVAASLEGRARVLESEIKQDAGRGVDVTKKQEGLADLTHRGQNAAMAQAQMMADASQNMEEVEKADAKKRVQEGADGKDKEEDGMKAEGENMQEDTAKDGLPVDYKPVNVLL